jgi:hypothetical protein
MYVEHRITTTDFNDLMHAKEKKVVLKERKKERKKDLRYLHGFEEPRQLFHEPPVPAKARSQ